MKNLSAIEKRMRFYTEKLKENTLNKTLHENEVHYYQIAIKVLGNLYEDIKDNII